MILKFFKSQKKGFSGKVSFEVKPSLILTDHELSLLDHYGLRKQVLVTRKTVSMLGNPTETEREVIADELLRGDVYRCNSLAEVIDYRVKVIQACKNLKVFLLAAESYEGTEQVDIDELLIEEGTMTTVEAP